MIKIKIIMNHEKHTMDVVIPLGSISLLEWKQNPEWREQVIDGFVRRFAMEITEGIRREISVRPVE